MPVLEGKWVIFPQLRYAIEIFNTKFHLANSCVAADNLGVNKCPKNQLDHGKDHLVSHKTRMHNPNFKETIECMAGLEVSFLFLSPSHATVALSS